jgi:ribosomal protein L37AE/L43A
MEDVVLNEETHASDLGFRELEKPSEKRELCPICGHKAVEERAGLKVCGCCDEVLEGG